MCDSKKLQIIIIVLFLFHLFPGLLVSQNDLSYKLESLGSLSTGETTPFWIVNNTYGLIPLKSDNAYLRGIVKGKYEIKKDFYVNAGIDLAGAANHSSSFLLQQLYGEIVFKSFLLTIGQKEYYNSFLNKELSSGDFNYSSNARPIPEVRIAIPEFVRFPFTNGFLKVRGDFTVGKSFDNDYINDTRKPGEDYALDILWHRKSLYLLFEDPENHFPFSFTFGLDHAVQWGGWSSWEDTGDIPQSFSDFVRVVFGQGGGDNSHIGEQVNVLGNHQGTYNARLTYKSEKFTLSAYKQHYFDDGSGMEYTNWRDGIYGLECSFNNQDYLKNIVFEYINTTDQSGSMHFIYYERKGARGGGNDDYYNHDFYKSGWSYWGRTIGNPLLTSPEYNGDGTLYLKNNRIKAWHLGLKGNINADLSYRVLATGMYAWGRHSFPFLKKKSSFVSMAECNYFLPGTRGWLVGLQLAIDRGNLYENNWGCSLKISKSGSFDF